MATVNINNDYRITSDEHQWTVQRRTNSVDKKGEIVWQGLSYHAELEQAANSLRGYLLRKSDANGIDEISAELRRIHTEISRAISARVAA